MMRYLAPHIVGAVCAVVFSGAAQAVLIKTTAMDLVTPGTISSGIVGQTLEDALNTEVFNPLGMTIEFATVDGGTPSADTMTFEGPGLTGVSILGQGFILRLDTPASDVRVRMLNYKDGGDRRLRGFDFAADFPRDPPPSIHHGQGEVTGSPPLTGSILDEDTQTLPAGTDGFVDLMVSDPSGGIASIHVTTFTSLWSLGEIEVTAAAAPMPEPGTLAILGLGLAGLGVARRRRLI